MVTIMNLCTSTLPGFNFEQALEIASLSGCRGIELRIADEHHLSLENALSNGVSISRAIKARNLEQSVLNSYIAVEDTQAVDQLIYSAQIMQTPKIRVVLPRAAHAAVAQQARINEGIPAYESDYHPAEIINRLRSCLANLEVKAQRAGVQILLELHWGTVMSSFTSAYLLVKDLDPDWIGITFDPANMLVEGKEDWEFGLRLLGKHIANVHVKNVVWKPSAEGWTWCWAPLKQGMIDWVELTSLLNQAGYQGDYAIEDFLAPQDYAKNSIEHIKNLRETLQEMLEDSCSNIHLYHGDYNQAFQSPGLI
jgi:sugar phosphate isomerase/epimerase